VNLVGSGVDRVDEVTEQVIFELITQGARPQAAVDPVDILLGIEVECRGGVMVLGAGGAVFFIEDRIYPRVGGELLFKLLQGADKSLGSESANGICST